MSNIIKKIYFLSIMIGLFSLFCINCKKGPTNIEEKYDKYFFEDNKKIMFAIVNGFITSEYENNVSREDINELNKEYNLTIADSIALPYHNTIYKLRIPDGNSSKDFITTFGDININRFGNNQKVKYALPVLKRVYEDGTTSKELTQFTNEIYVHSLEGHNIENEEIDSLISKYKIEFFHSYSITGIVNYVFYLTKNSPFDPIDLSVNICDNYNYNAIPSFLTKY